MTWKIVGAAEVSVLYIYIDNNTKESFLHKQEKENGKMSKLCDDLSGDGIAQALVNRIRPEMYRK